MARQRRNHWYLHRELLRDGDLEGKQQALSWSNLDEPRHTLDR